MSTLGGAIAPVAPPCLRAYSELTLTRRACDSDSTKLNRAHHWKSRIYPDPILIQFSLKMIIQIQPVSNKSWILLDKSCPIDDNIQRQVKSLYCAGNKLRGTFDQCSPAVKTLYFVPIASQWMLASSGANTRRPVLSAYVLRITMPSELCILYDGDQTL